MTFKKLTVTNGLQDVDMAIGPLGLVATRQAFLDFSYPYNIGTYQLMIPAPKLASNFAAPWKPFSFQVQRDLSYKESHHFNFVLRSDLDPFNRFYSDHSIRLEFYKSNR
jgi:hypothetical protein